MSFDPGDTVEACIPGWGQGTAPDRFLGIVETVAQGALGKVLTIRTEEGRAVDLAESFVRHTSVAVTALWEEPSREYAKAIVAIGETLDLCQGLESKIQDAIRELPDSAYVQRQVLTRSLTAIQAQKRMLEGLRSRLVNFSQ